MSWIHSSRPVNAGQGRQNQLQSQGCTEAALEELHRGLVLVSASQRLQDSISSRRAKAEARSLLTRVRRMCEEAGSDFEADRVRRGIDSLARALERE